MSLTLLLLQVVNAALAAGSLWIHFRHPTAWDNQAILFCTLSGVVTASATAVVLGFGMLLSAGLKWRSTLFHLALTLLFAAVQAYLLYLSGKDMGLIKLLELKLR